MTDHNDLNKRCAQMQRWKKVTRVNQDWWEWQDKNGKTKRILCYDYDPKNDLNQAMAFADEMFQSGKIKAYMVICDTGKWGQRREVFVENNNGKEVFDSVNDNGLSTVLINCIIEALEGR